MSHAAQDRMAAQGVFVDGMPLDRKTVVLIACNDERTLGQHLRRSENSRARPALMSLIAAPEVTVSNSGGGLAKTLREARPETRHQKCAFHAFGRTRR